MDGLFDEMNRVREIIKEYEAIPGGAGRLAALLMRQAIQEAETAIRENDIMKMLPAYQNLKEFEL